MTPPGRLAIPRRGRALHAHVRRMTVCSAVFTEGRKPFVVWLFSAVGECVTFVPCSVEPALQLPNLSLALENRCFFTEGGMKKPHL